MSNLRKIKRNMAKNQLRDEGYTRTCSQHFGLGNLKDSMFRHNWREACDRRVSKTYRKKKRR